MDFNTFLSDIESGEKSGDIFLQMLCYLYINLPVTRESVWIYNRFYKKRKSGLTGINVSDTNDDSSSSLLSNQVPYSPNISINSINNLSPLTDFFKINNTQTNKTRLSLNKFKSEINKKRTNTPNMRINVHSFLYKTKKSRTFDFENVKKKIFLAHKKVESESTGTTSAENFGFLSSRTFERTNSDINDLAGSSGVTGLINSNYVRRPRLSNKTVQMPTNKKSNHLNSLLIKSPGKDIKFEDKEKIKSKKSNNTNIYSERERNKRMNTISFTNTMLEANNKKFANSEDKNNATDNNLYEYKKIIIDPYNHIKYEHKFELNEAIVKEDHEEEDREDKGDSADEDKDNENINIIKTDAGNSESSIKGSIKGDKNEGSIHSSQNLKNSKSFHEDEVNIDKINPSIYNDKINPSIYNTDMAFDKNDESNENVYISPPLSKNKLEDSISLLQLANNSKAKFSPFKPIHDIVNESDYIQAKVNKLKYVKPIMIKKTVNNYNNYKM